MEAEVFPFAYIWEGSNNGIEDNASTVSVGNGTAPFIDNDAVGKLVPIVAYCVMFVVAATGNLAVLISLLRAPRKSRVGLLLLHLTVADLIVTFFMIPMEITWRVTNQWTAGNATCKIFMMVRAFGPYLSSNVLICITLDRYFVILHPLRIGDARRRGKVMLTIAWIASLVSAFPQSIVFKVLQHPMDPSFHQCVTFGSFANETEEMLYNLFCLATMYFVPLSVIVFSYACILCEITTKSRENIDDCNVGTKKNRRISLRRSDQSTIARAKTKTLKMTITIVAAFIWCWTPYVVMTLWYMFDRSSAQMIDKQLQEILFLMAVSNSCVNPAVYGSYVLNLKMSCRFFGFPVSYLKRRSTSYKVNTVVMLEEDIPKRDYLFPGNKCFQRLSEGNNSYRFGTSSAEPAITRFKFRSHSS